MAAAVADKSKRDEERGHITASFITGKGGLKENSNMTKKKSERKKKRQEAKQEG